MTPEEIQAHTLEFQIWPAYVGGWIVRVSKRGTFVSTRHCVDVEDAVRKLKEETLEFYCEETDCPECEDQTIVEKP